MAPQSRGIWYGSGVFGSLRSGAKTAIEISSVMITSPTTVVGFLSSERMSSPLRRRRTRNAESAVAIGGLGAE